MRAQKLATALAAVPLIWANAAGIALADDISNNLDGSVDVVAEVMPLNAGGPNGTTQLYVLEQRGDGKNGCNLTGSTTLVLSVSSANTAVATVSPSQVTFGSCGETKTLTVTPVAQGTATITATQVSNNTGGTFNLAPATFTVNVSAAAPANTAPRVSVSGVTGGASYSKGSVPAATCMVTDTEDGNSSFPATLSAVTGDHAADGIGSQTASCSYRDAGGLAAVSSETYTIVDPSAPVITPVLTPAEPDGENGWYRSDVQLVWNVSDPQSPSSLQKTGCLDTSVVADQVPTDYSCSATSAGGTTSAESVRIKRDSAGPVVTLTDVEGTEGNNGWYTSPIKVTFTATDTLSGPATPTQTVTSSGEGASVVVESPEFSDLAGNTTPAGALVDSYKIDSQAPAAPEASLSPAPNGAGWNNSDVVVHFEPTGDTGASGVASCTADVPVKAETAGQTVSGTCTDMAGNVSAPTEVTVKLDKTGPTISEVVTVAGDLGDNGWYTSDVEVTFTATDALSGLATASKTVKSSGEGAAVKVESPEFTDNAGNTTSGVPRYFKIDSQAPNKPVASLSPAPNGAGWNNSDVVVHFEPAGDNGASGVASCTANVPVTEETAGQTVTGTCKDVAGNVSAATEITVQLDKTAPTLVDEVTVEGDLGDNGWYTGDVKVTFTATDDLSGPATASKTVTSSGEGEDVVVESPGFTDAAGNTTPAGTVTKHFKIDEQAPNAPVASLSPAPNGARWNNTDLVVHFAADGDNGASGVAECTADVPVTEETAGQTVTGTCKDRAGNVSATTTVTVKLDRTAPTGVTFVGGPVEGGKYYPNNLAAKPTCTASDALSGLASCVVTGYSNDVGEQVMTATATDAAGNKTVATRTYRVRKLSISGFYAPVDKGIHNTVKSGATVPLKFEVFDEGTELRDVGKVKGFTTRLASCSSGLPEDAIEEVAASTSTAGLRFDPTSDHFVYNWKTSGKAGTCIEVKMTTEDDSSTTALFKLK